MLKMDENLLFSFYLGFLRGYVSYVAAPVMNSFSIILILNLLLQTQDSFDDDVSSPLY